MFLFSGGCPSAYIKQSLFIHSTSGNGGKPVKKIPASATVLPTMKVEVQSPYNRISISHNRKGHKAFAVFLLSFLVGKCRRTISLAMLHEFSQSLPVPVQALHKTEHHPSDFQVLYFLLRLQIRLHHSNCLPDHDR